MKLKRPWHGSAKPNGQWSQRAKNNQAVKAARQRKASGYLSPKDQASKDYWAEYRAAELAELRKKY